MTFADDCRIIQFKEEIKDMVLINNVVQSYRVANQEICKIRCYLERKCVSYNYGPLEDGSFLCEVNEKHHLQAPSNDFAARDGYVYSRILVSRGTIYWPRAPSFKYCSYDSMKEGSLKTIRFQNLLKC